MTRATDIRKLAAVSMEDYHYIECWKCWQKRKLVRSFEDCQSHPSPRLVIINKINWLLGEHELVVKCEV